MYKLYHLSLSLVDLLTMKNDNNSLLLAVQNSMFVVEQAGSFPHICALHELGSSNSHNCLACNFADLVIDLESLAKDIGKFSDQRVAKITFILWLYLLAERMQEVLKLLSFPENIKNEKFIFFKKIKKWGNFLKHPKAFFLTHHSSFDQFSEDAYQIIDDDFIAKFYGGNEKNTELYQLLTNKNRVDVKLPDLIELTNGLGKELEYLCEEILKTPSYKQVLTDKSVLKDYFSGDIG